MENSLDSKWSPLEESIQDIMQEFNVPGVAVGLVMGDETLQKGIGIASVKAPEAVDEDTGFQIGSISKTFTGTVIMRLVEEGKLSLDTTVASILPNFRVADREVSSKVTFNHLLTHSAGWTGDFFIQTGSGADASRKFVERMIELEQLIPLGEVHSYNNSCFCLLGYLIEVLTESAFSHVVEEFVLAPLEMKATAFDLANLKTAAIGHLNRNCILTPFKLPGVPRAALPSGGLISNVNDMLKYLQYQLHGEISNNQRCITSESRLKMQSPSGVTTPIGDHQGLPWKLVEMDGTVIRLHGGRTAGFNALTFFVPERNFGAVILTNSETGRTLIDRTWPQIAETYLGISFPEHELVEASPGLKEEVVGRYELSRVSITDIGLVGEMLVANVTFTGGLPGDIPPPTPYRLAYVGNDRLKILDGENKDGLVDLIRDEQGKIAWLWSGGRLQKRVDQ